MRLRSWGLALFLVLSAGRAEATMVVFEDDNALFEKADIVMLANVWRWDTRPTPMFDVTDYELESLECFKGCQQGQFFVMTVPGVAPHRAVGMQEQIAGAPHVEAGERVVVHLRRVPTGELVLISLGLSQYKLRYDAVMHRYFADRQIEALALMKPGVTRDDGGEVVVPKTVFASDLIDALRAKAAGR